MKISFFNDVIGGSILCISFFLIPIVKYSSQNDNVAILLDDIMFHIFGLF